MSKLFKTRIVSFSFRLFLKSRKKGIEVNATFEAETIKTEPAELYASKHGVQFIVSDLAEGTLISAYRIESQNLKLF